MINDKAAERIAEGLFTVLRDAAKWHADSHGNSAFLGCKEIATALDGVAASISELADAIKDTKLP